jgi:hypothetical protein
VAAAKSGGVRDKGSLAGEPEFRMGPVADGSFPPTGGRTRHRSPEIEGGERIGRHFCLGDGSWLGWQMN